MTPVDVSLGNYVRLVRRWQKTRALLWILALNSACVLPESMLVGAAEHDGAGGNDADSGGAGMRGDKSDASRQPSAGAAGLCTALTERCNGKDDDCDGRVDELGAVALDCASQVLNAPSVCREGFCLKAGDCDPGYFNCDGVPGNGCEYRCGCAESCEEDAGA